MNQLPRWIVVSFAERARSTGNIVKNERTHAVSWVAEDRLPAAEGSLTTSTAAIAVAALIAAPIRDLADDAVLDDNAALATSLSDWTMRINGMQISRAELHFAIDEAATMLDSVEAEVADVLNRLDERLQGCQFEQILPLGLSEDADGYQLPARPQVYVASALTGFGDAASEWFWVHDLVDAPGATRKPDGTFDDERRGRGVIGLDFQRKANRRVAERLRAIGIDVFLPQETFDPDKNSDRTPEAVDLGDRLGIAGSDAIVLLADYPALGAGKELVLAEAGLQSTLITASMGTRTSRLVSGTSHRTREIWGHYSDWPGMVADHILRDLSIHEHHAHVRQANAARAASLVSPFRVTRSSSSLLTPARASQLTQHPSLVPSASLLEIQELARMSGYFLEVRLRRMADGGPADRHYDLQELQIIANEFLEAGPDIGTSAPNSPTRLLRALDVREPTIDESIEGEAETRRFPDGSIEVSMRTNNRGRERFTIAHEAAHIILEGEALTVSHRKGTKPDRDLELAADRLAALLLLPTSWLASRIADGAREGLRAGSYRLLESIASTAGLSVQAVAMRLTMFDSERPIVHLRLVPQGEAWSVERASGLPPDWVRRIKPSISGLPQPSGTQGNVDDVQVELRLATGETHAGLADFRRAGSSAVVVVQTDNFPALGASTS